MKKLMMVVAVALAAVSVNAASINWKSGDMMRATSAEGGWSSSKYMTDATKSSFTGMFFMITDADEWTAVGKMSQAELYATYSTKTPTLTNTSSADSLTLTSTGLANGTYNGVMIYTYKDADLGNAEFYMATTASKQVTADQTYSVTKIGNTQGAATGWQAVPEPTSGLLLLIGMAGLALRRRRA